VCVGTGLALALSASAESGRLREPDLVGRTRELLERLGLCPTLGDLRARFGVALPAERLRVGMRLDKKGSAEEPAFVLPTGLGQVALDVPLDPALLARILE